MSVALSLTFWSRFSVLGVSVTPIVFAIGDGEQEGKLLGGELRDILEEL